jgi:hypothetical protein
MLCAGGVVPGVSRHAFKTPFSEGVQSFPVWRPWLDAADAENILFARCFAPLKLPTDLPFSQAADTHQSRTIV